MRSPHRAGLERPIGPKKMTRQRTAPRVGGALVQLPDQVPADASQTHRRHRPLLGQRLEPRQQALLRQHQSRHAVVKILRKLRALPHPERLDTPRHLLDQRLDVLAVQLPVWRSTHSSAPRSVAIAASKASNPPMASVHSRRVLDRARLALRRRALSCARILPNRPSASPSRSIAACGFRPKPSIPSLRYSPPTS